MKERNRRDWREICDEVLREKQTNRVNELLEELLEALEDRARKHGRRSASVSEP